MPEQTTPPPSGDAMPSWWAPLMLRAHDVTLPDQDLADCLAYLAKLRRERDRLLADLTAGRRRLSPAQAAALLDLLIKPSKAGAE